MSEGGQVNCICHQRSSGMNCAKNTFVNDDEKATDDFSLKVVENKVIHYYKKGDAQAILSLLSGTDNCSHNGVIKGQNNHWDPLLLWVKPSLCCLQFLASHVKDADRCAVASIGCGTGLLEWLIHATTGLCVTGYEINGEWWCSKYAPPTFIPLTYVDPKTDPPAVPDTHALMCCYFNNASVFRQYVEAYEGPVLIIIGSVNKRRFSEPKPLDYVNVHPWTLVNTHNISDTDIIACYIRDQRKVDIVNRLRFPRRMYL